MSGEIERDPELADLLHEAVPTPPAADWGALQRRITASAALPLARARRRAAFVRSLRTWVPLAAAAGLAGAYLALTPGRAAPRPEEQVMIDRMVDASLPEAVDQLISGEAARGALLEVVGGS